MLVAAKVLNKDGLFVNTGKVICLSVCLYYVSFLTVTLPTVINLQSSYHKNLIFFTALFAYAVTNIYSVVNMLRIYHELHKEIPIGILVETAGDGSFLDISHWIWQ